MKYRLKQGLEPRAFSMGRTLYFLDSTTFRSYPDNVISFFQEWLDAETEPKPKKIKPENEIIEDVNNG